jgi:hypothetical protein
MAGAVLVVLSTSGVASGQPWSGVLAPSRATDWGNAGLPATLPSGETTPNPWTPPTRTKACATIAPEGTSAAPVAPTDLNAAIQTCPAGQVVQLQAGSYYFNDSINLYCTTSSPCAVKSVTLRGAGADQTKIYFSSTASFTLGGNQYAEWASLASAPVSGSTTVELSAPDSQITPGTMIGITQCTTGASGAVSGSGLTCTATNGVAIYDNGGKFVCIWDGPYCSHGMTPAQTTALNDEAMPGEDQAVQVTAVSGTTLTVAPPIFLDDLSTSNTLAVWFGYPTSSGVGVEDVSLDFTSSTAASALSMAGCYGCWVKGTRIIAGVNNSQAFVMDRLVQYLLANNYLFSFNSGNYGFLNGGSYGLSSGLILNNITEHLCGIEWTGSGEVIGYDYSLPEVTENYFSHTGGTNLNLLEGNHALEFTDDGVHGTHDTTTLFRNHFEGQAAYLYDDSNDYLPPVQLGSGTRFDNFIGNVLGSPGLQTSYENGSSPVYTLGLMSMRGGVGTALFDPTSQATAMFWGNYDGYHGAVEWNAFEVPSALTTWNGFQQEIGTGDGMNKTFSATLTNVPVLGGDVILGDNDDVFFAYDDAAGGWTLYGVFNGAPTQPVTAGSIDYATGAISATFAVAPSAGATIFVNYLQPSTTASPYRNPVPPKTLPPSFFLPVADGHPNGGTGLSWWKVCTNYPTCSTFETPPFPPIGPDVSGGPGPGGHAFAIPAEIAYQYLPVDPAYEEPVSVSGATWSSSNGGQATVTLSSVPALANDPEYKFLAGQFTLSGVTPSGYNGTFNVTSSSCTTTCTVTYALPTNPGTYSAAGTFTWPLVRQFNETVYTTDLATESDSGVAGRDGGVLDASPPSDAGPGTSSEAGSSGADGGSAAPTSGGTGGCGCQAAQRKSPIGGVLSAWVLVGLVAARRRRRAN